MKNLIKTAFGIAASSALDGTLNANDLRSNKKKVAITLAKSVGWTIVQNHPAYIMAKLVLWALGAVIFLLLAGVIAWFVW
ncbi:hypothetical protein G6L37_07265 [Agrobacterium rubi]|nr:hypothetical protein [Agrobacterium rubi]NTF25166.1 hypothetical protein [Agrobacterium rubi]